MADRPRALPAPARPAAVLDEAWAPALRVAWSALWRSRLVVWAAGVAAVAVLGLTGRQEAFDPAGATAPFGPVGDALVAPAARWDAVWFLEIARDGYDPGDPRAAFFPLYPALVRVAGVLVGSPLVGGIALSVACLLVALTVLYRLVELDFGAEVAALCVTLVAFFPTAFFLSAVYSEALFLALSVGCVYAARTGRWAWAGAVGGLAASTRSAGLVLLVPLALLWWSGGRSWRDAAWLAVVPAGTGAFCALLAAQGADPLAPFAAQEHWMRTFAAPLGAVPDAVVAGWEGARQLLSGSREPVFFTAAGGDPFDVARANLTDLAFLAAALLATAGALRRLPAAYGAYAVAALALPLSWPVPPQPLMSLPRFLVVLWPLHLWLALVLIGRPRARRTVLAVSAGLLALFSALFARWVWVA